MGEETLEEMLKVYVGKREDKWFSVYRAGEPKYKRDKSFDTVEDAALYAAGKFKDKKVHYELEGQDWVVFCNTYFSNVGNKK